MEKKNYTLNELPKDLQDEIITREIEIQKEMDKDNGVKNIPLTRKQARRTIEINEHLFDKEGTFVNFKRLEVKAKQFKDNNKFKVLIKAFRKIKDREEFMGSYCFSSLKFEPYLNARNVETKIITLKKILDTISRRGLISNSDYLHYSCKRICVTKDTRLEISFYEGL